MSESAPADIIYYVNISSDRGGFTLVTPEAFEAVAMAQIWTSQGYSVVIDPPVDA